MTNLDYEAWRCCHEGEGESLFCPPEGCPKGYCARDAGWKPGDPSPRECLPGSVVAFPGGCRGEGFTRDQHGGLVVCDESGCH